MWVGEVFVTEMVRTRVSKLFSVKVLTRNRKLHNLLHRRPSFGMQNFGPCFCSKAHICHKYYKLYLWRKTSFGMQNFGPGFCSSPFPNGQLGGTLGKPILSCTNITHQLLQSSVIEERSALPRLKGNLCSCKNFPYILCFFGARYWCWCIMYLSCYSR